MYRIVAAFFAFWLMAGTVHAQSGETPMALDGATVVTPEAAKDLLAKGAKVFDFRRKAAFADGHIPGAVSAASAYNQDTKLVDPAVFGASKDQAIIIHGHGSDGWTAVAGVKAAVGAGFTKVYWLRTGWADWQAKGMPVEQ